MITISGLRRSFGARDLFRDAELRIGARDRMALVGPNGSGKTTLFEMIMGLQAPDDGRIATTSGVRLGYLAQETDALRGRSVLEEVVSAGTAMAQAGHRLQILERELEDLADEDERSKLLEEYAHLTERFDALGGYTLETQAKQILAGLGFRERDGARRTESLSGGWLMRVALAKLLLAAPDALLLDEPTNHLDLESVVWLERFLKGYEGAVMLISHDRDFINGLATRIVEIEAAQLVSYTGNYASFVHQRAQRAEQAAAMAKNQARRRAQLELFINRFRYKQSLASRVQSKIKMLDKMEAIPTAPERHRAMRLKFPTPPRAGRIVIEMSGVEFAYAETPVYRGLDLSIERGSKIALVGPNGAGKTTLLKLCAGALGPTAGERALGANVAVGYFAQHQIEALDPSKRVIEELRRAIPHGATVRARDLLGRFLFSGEDVDKPVSVLSGGERSRLALAKLLAAPFNVLCMDEPTNHLDIMSRDMLEDALEEYEGTLVLITHDRHLIRNVANRIVEVIDGRVREFPGDYQDYLERKAAEDAPPAAPAERRTDEARERRRSTAQDRQRSARARNAVRAVERELEQVHAVRDALGLKLADPSFYTSGNGVAEVVREYEYSEKHIAELEKDWERLSEEL